MEDDMRQVILDIVEAGSVVFTNHAKDRMGMRGYTVHDVLRILHDGTVKSVTEEGAGRYRCEISGEDINGDPGAIVVSVIKRSKIVVITVLGGT
jgi:c-di-GMP-binding flagellar brake protein YcgR